jgi:hypothetical protein
MTLNEMNKVFPLNSEGKSNNSVVNGIFFHIWKKQIFALSTFAWVEENTVRFKLG